MQYIYYIYVHIYKKKNLLVIKFDASTYEINNTVYFYLHFLDFAAYLEKNINNVSLFRVKNNKLIQSYCNKYT